METPDHLEQWVNDRMSASGLATRWPERASGRRRLDERLATRPRRVLLWAGATAALCAAVLALPATRAVAQRLWDRVVLGRLQVLVTDYDGHGTAVDVYSLEAQLRPEARPVASIDEASLAAGFSPRLPAPGVFPALPSYSVTDVASARLRLRAPAIRYLFAEAGGSAGDVPDSWDGAALEMRAGPAIIADYDGILLIQSLPFELVTPAGFDLELFYRIALRSLGMREPDAQALGADLAISPALLMVMPGEDRELLHEFETKAGRGVMIDEVYGPGTTVALWSGSDRLYALFPTTGQVSRELVIRVAGVLD